MNAVFSVHIHNHIDRIPFKPNESTSLALSSSFDWFSSGTLTKHFEPNMHRWLKGAWLKTFSYGVCSREHARGASIVYVYMSERAFAPKVFA